MKKNTTFLKIFYTITISLLSILSSIAQQHGKNVIGVIVDGNPVLTMDTQYVENWNKVLQEGGLQLTITVIEIGYDKEGVYMLLGTNKNKSFESAIDLILDEGKLYESLVNNGGGLTVTCTGCAIACHVAKDRDRKPICWPECPGQDCKKTETQTSGAILVSSK